MRDNKGNKNPMFGKKHSEATKEKIRQKALERKSYVRTEKHKEQVRKRFSGIPKTEEMKEKISKTQKFKYSQGIVVPWNKGKVGVMPKPWNKGIKRTKKERENISISLKKMKFGQKFRQLLINNGKKTAKLINKNDTSIERKIENWLLFNNILYIKQFEYKFGLADFWLPENNIIVECDGDYWHSLSGCKERDKRQTEWLENNDFNVLRFTETNIKNNFNVCIGEIESAV